MSKFLDENGLSFLWTKIKTLISGAVSSAESKLSNYLPLTGGTMTGNLQTPKVTVTDKTSDDILLGDGSTTSLSSIKGAYLPLSGGTMTGAVKFNPKGINDRSYAKIDYSKLYLTAQGTDIYETTINSGRIELSGMHFIMDIKESIHCTTSIADTAITTTGSVTAAKFIATDKTADDLLLGDGTTTSLSAIKGAYLPLAGGKMNTGAQISITDGDSSPDTLTLTPSEISLTTWNDKVVAGTFISPGNINFTGSGNEGKCYINKDSLEFDDGDDTSIFSHSKVEFTNGSTISTLSNDSLSTYTVNTHTIKGRALPGTENEDLILGSYNGTFMSTGQFTDIGDYSGIIIGGQMNDNGTTDNPSHRGLAVVSPHYVHLASKDDIELRAATLIQSISGGSIEQTAKYYIHNTAGSGYDLTVAGHTNIKAQPSELKIMSPASNGQIHIQTNDLRLGKYVSESTADSSYIEANTIADGAVVEINDNGYGAMIQTCSNKYVKFRVDGDTTMRLNAANDTNPGGLRVFTNIFANTDHVTDMPSYITNDTKTTLNTKSLQSLIAPYLQEVQCSKGNVCFNDIYVNTTLGPLGIFHPYEEDYLGSVVIGIDAAEDPQGDARLYIGTENGIYRFNTDKAIELGLLVKD